MTLTLTVTSEVSMAVEARVNHPVLVPIEWPSGRGACESLHQAFGFWSRDIRRLGRRAVATVLVPIAGL